MTIDGRVSERFRLFGYTCLNKRIEISDQKCEKGGL